MGSNEVQIWRADLDAFRMTLPADTFLAPDERSRALRFHFERDRQRFSAGRQILRLLLSRYLGVDASQVELRYSAHSKPELGGLQADSGALFAFSRRRAVGIDVERERTNIEVCDIATRFFSESEQAVLLGLARDQQPQ